MSVLYWSYTRQKISWIICIFLLSISAANGDFNEGEEEESEVSFAAKEPGSGSLRLANGTASSGRLEIYYEGEWGTICNDGWSRKEADVVCRSLGFGNGIPLQMSGGSGKIFLAEVRCDGDEESILRCNNNKFEPHGCTHQTDVGVNCAGVFTSVANINTQYACTFDAGLCGYSTSSSGQFTWRRQSGRTPSSSTGPTFDHTTGTTMGYYMYTEASSGSMGDVARLKRSFSGTWVNSIKFWYHMYGSSMGKLDVIIGRYGSTSTIWSRKGDQGNLWQSVCIPIGSTITSIEFKGTRGSSYTGDMAVDDVYLSKSGCQGLEDGATCSFNGGMCGYQTIMGNDSTVTWRLTPRLPGPTSVDGSCVVFDSYGGREGMKSYFVSQPFEIDGDTKVEFSYYMMSRLSGELQVSFKDRDTPLNSWSGNDWQDYGDHGYTWNYGCMNLHPKPNRYGNVTKRLVFTGIAGSHTGLYLALDDIKVNNGTCGSGINDHICTFDNPKICNYKINCTARQEYTWRRMIGPTSSLRTGPASDASKDNGHYLYAESSYGRAGDAVSIKFPVKNTKGKYIKFHYNMYGQSMGSLILRYSSGKSVYDVWKVSGNQGKTWEPFCQRIDVNIDAVMLVAVRGYRYTSDIAVDNVFLDSKPCPNPVNCDFEHGMCNYTIYSGSSRYYWKMAAGQDHTYSNGHYVMASNPLGYEGISTTVMTPYITQSSNTSSMKFYYQSSSLDSDKLMVELNSSSSFNMAGMAGMGPKLFRMDFEGWVMGCIDLPPNEDVSVNFTAISGALSGSATMLDDIYYDESPCVVGILNNVCTFDEPNICGYNVSCYEATPFLWRRGRRTNSSLTGPQSDVDQGNGYFMYTESSLGSPGDTTDLEFPEFVTPPGHYLGFYYSMYGRDIGTLQVHIKTANGKELRWTEKGNIDQYWMKGCVNLPVNESATVVFTGIRGNGPLGDIAIDNVGVVPGVCHERSIACDFSDEMLCGYRNQSGPFRNSWVREKSGSDHYMTVTAQNGQYVMASPFGNLTDKCVQISYKITGDRCTLDVLTMHNKKRQLHLYDLYANIPIYGPANLNNNSMDWVKAQFYIQQAETHLVFSASIISNWYSSCTIKIGKIDLNDGTCPTLVCPFNSTSCGDQTKCIPNSLVCDRNIDCSDASDENNCPQSIACDFEHPYLCGYNYTYGWYQIELSNLGNPDLKLNNSVYAMSLNSAKSSLFSPKETIQSSCVQFNYAAGTGSSLNVMAHYSDGGNITKWSIDIAHHTKWTIGQFELPAGSVYLEFSGSVGTLGLLLDNVDLEQGTCGRIVCPDGFFACGSNEKCITQENKCNRVAECDDSSDEVDCPKSIACDAEHPYQCGYDYIPYEWQVTSGRDMDYPDLDHSVGIYSGRYFASRIWGNDSDHTLKAPKETLPVDACMTFYYSFFGTGDFEISDNGKEQLTIKPNNINTWQKSQIQLMAGIHKIGFSHKAGNHTSTNNILALDSISLQNGTCGSFACEEGWKQCRNAPICIPKFKFCDHEVDCPLGEDEQNCQSYTDIRLSGGRNVQQGFVEIYYRSEWARSCGSIYSTDASFVCSKLGHNGTARSYFTTQQSESTRTSISNFRCYGYEKSIRDCRISSCYSYCTCSDPAAVDCSDSYCESTHVPCANATNNSSLTGMCIPKESVCDGEKDCPGGTDEDSCSKCGATDFQCLNYGCVPENLRCDGYNDCADGSDEFHCFKHVNTDLSYLMNGQFYPVCQNNFNEPYIADKVCEFVGKGHGSFGTAGAQTVGVQFIHSPAFEEGSVLYGFRPTLSSTCNPASLTCKRRECGRRSPNLYDPLIQHGHKAIPGEFPWQVSLHFDDRFICGGTLIDERFVITAAHCVRTSSSGSRYQVFVGSTYRYGGIRVDIKRVIAHKEFTMSLLRYDIALLELATPVTMTDYIRPACLPTKPWTPHTHCFTSGWGRIEDNTSPTDLYETKVLLMSRAECMKDYIHSDNTTVCANHKQPNQPGCYGDSGGPLVCRNEQGYWELIGVTSYGRRNCAGPVSSPQVYADVYTFRDWVLERM